MNDKGATQNPSRSRTVSLQRKRTKWIVVSILVIALTSLLAVGGRWQYRKFQRQRLVERSRVSLEKMDYRQASISIQRALKLDPRDLEINRLMLDLSMVVNSKQALHWHQMLVQLEPAALENHLALAECALRFQEFDAAEQALAKVTAEGKKTAAFHNIAGRLAQALNKTADAESHFALATKLEPQSEKFRLDLAMAHLRSPAEELRKEARSVLEQFKPESKSYRIASRALVEVAIENKELDKALSLAKTLRETPGATFEDQLLHLGILRQQELPDFQQHFLDLQERSQAQPDQVASLIAWMNRNDMNSEALEWSTRLPPKICDRPPVSPALAQCCAKLHDWVALKKLVSTADGKEPDWQGLEYSRFALLALVAREQNDPLNSRNHWNRAIKAASARPEAMVALARFATALNWDGEASDLLWQISGGHPNQLWALDALWRRYTESHDIRAMMKVLDRALQIDPEDALSKNRFATLSFQTNSNLDRARMLARKAYETDAKNPYFAATYAYALYLEDKAKEGFDIICSLPEDIRNKPPYATFNAVLTASAGNIEEAKKALDLARRGWLEPEEKELLEKSRVILRRRE